MARNDSGYRDPVVVDDSGARIDGPAMHPRVHGLCVAQL